MEENTMNVSADHVEPAFFSDELTISHTQAKFIFDFTQTTPRFDRIADKRHQSLTIKHKTILLDPMMAKAIFTILKENLERYEKKFGEIKIPKQKVKKTEKVETTAESVSYIG